MDRNPCLFVIGCPRSGTTLLRRMLDHHPDLAVSNEAHFTYGALGADAVHSGDPPLDAAMVEGVRDHPAFELARRCRTSWEAQMRARKGRLASRLDLSPELELLAETR